MFFFILAPLLLYVLSPPLCLLPSASTPALNWESPSGGERQTVREREAAGGSGAAPAAHITLSTNPAHFLGGGNKEDVKAVSVAAVSGAPYTGTGQRDWGRVGPRAGPE